MWPFEFGAKSRSTAGKGAQLFFSRHNGGFNKVAEKILVKKVMLGTLTKGLFISHVFLKARDKGGAHPDSVQKGTITIKK